MSFLGFDSLFAVRDPLASRPYRALLEGDIPSGGPTMLLRGEARASQLVARRKLGSTTPSDVIWTAWGNVVLFSPRVTEELQRAGLTGWTTLPVTVGTPGGSLPYGFLVVHGRCARRDLQRSSREWSIYPGGRVPQLRGFYFEESSWDGSDFFMEDRETGWVIVTRRVVDLFRRNRIKNIQFDRLDEIETRADAPT